MQRSLFPLIVLAIMLALDYYVFQGYKNLIGNWALKTQSIFKVGYWLLTATSLISFLYAISQMSFGATSMAPRLIMSMVFVLFVAKLFWAVFLGIDDFTRLVRWIGGYFSKNQTASENGISRHSFIVKTGALVATSFLGAMTYGVSKGSHRYRVIRKKLKINNLPASFAGLKLLQISDIHSGSFWSKKEVERGVNMILKEEADLVFFTGDLVNNVAEEMDDYLDVFGKISAPLGVFSVLGNHDYGEYVAGFNSERDLANNIEKLTQVHGKLGWDLLNNEHRVITKNGEKLGIVGIENWGNKMHFKKYGNMKKALHNMEDVPVKLLLSHDPSHWKGEVLKDYPEIDVTFSGHTHGMQFGLETAGFKWSPIKYFYNEWAGLYTEGEQQLYVNRGFGYLGFPGRLGIWPEITVFELETA
ncbi:MAG: putative MPP superfamily phosphohydrolase [Bacteroidia bacterium]|jgi:predicted MPP superfamily phosphohydrolase